jgi:hypothetical protein
MDAAPPGSYLAIAQIAGDIATDEVAEGVQRYNEQAAAPVAARTHAEVCRFFAGLDLGEPGVVQVHRWRPEPGTWATTVSSPFTPGSRGSHNLWRCHAGSVITALFLMSGQPDAKVGL